MTARRGKAGRKPPPRSTPRRVARRRRTTKATPSRVTLKDLARLLGVDEKAVRKGVQSGRLSAAAVGRTAKGRPVVLDAKLAQREWAENAGRPNVSAETSSGPGPTLTLVEAQRLTALQRERRLKFENDLRAGELVDVAQVTREAFEGARIIREAILNLPARIAAELAAESDAGRVYLKLDAALREILRTTAATLEATARAM